MPAGRDYCLLLLAWLKKGLLISSELPTAVGIAVSVETEKTVETCYVTQCCMHVSNWNKKQVNILMCSSKEGRRTDSPGVNKYMKVVKSFFDGCSCPEPSLVYWNHILVPRDETGGRGGWEEMLRKNIFQVNTELNYNTVLGMYQFVQTEQMF